MTVVIMTATSGLAAYIPANRIDALRARVRAEARDRTSAVTPAVVAASAPASFHVSAPALARATLAEWLVMPALAPGLRLAGAPQPDAADVAPAANGRAPAAKAMVSGLGRTISRATGRAASAVDADLAFPRVRIAVSHKQAVVERALARNGVHQLEELYLRVFKQEKVLEVWARGAMQDRFVKVAQFPVCEISGRPGPKRREGDWQVPEGFYRINSLNPWSNFHLSLHVSYPNRADRVRNRKERRLGGAIMIHGGCASIGCVAITDPNIEELYTFFLELPEARRRAVPVAIYPARLDAHGIGWLRGSYGASAPEYPFWVNLKQGYDYFERTHRLPVVKVARNGRYVFSERPRPRRAELQLKAPPVITTVKPVGSGGN